MKWWLPILVMAILAPFTPFLDLTLSRHFYNPETHEFTSNAFIQFMYDYGNYPANILIAFALIVLLLPLTALKKWKRPALVLALTALLGSLLIVQVILKDHWGRPRPKQVIEFGGMQEFRPFYKPNFFNQPEPSKSFTCGHCVSGFYFFALALVGRRIQSRSVFWIGLALALGLGITLSMTRIAQGGHFLSDTLMSALIMWLVALTCDWLTYENKQTIA